MAEPKPFASLSSSLLARKGQAKPAMRPQGFGGFFGGGGAPQHNPLEDLGWNDMGHHAAPSPAPAPEPAPTAEIVPITPAIAAPEPAPEPVEPPAVVRQQEELARELSPQVIEEVKATVAAKTPRAAPGSKGKAAFTLRLDPDRHLKLRLFAAMSHRSAQAVVCEALDRFLDAQPAVAALAERAKSN